MTDGDVEAARNRVIGAMETSAAEYGLPRSCGRLYGILYFADGPLSMDELADRSGYAKSTVSDVTRALEDIYLIRRVGAPEGGRRAYFEAERDLWYTLQQVAERAGRREIEVMRRALDEAERTLAEGDAETDLERVRRLQETYEQFSLALDLLDGLSAEQLLGLLARLADGVDPADLPADVDVPHAVDTDDQPAGERDGRPGDDRRVER